MSDVRATVLVLAKEPVPGRVKTRLCPPCTPAEAAAIARAAIADTIATVTAVDDVRAVLVLDGEPGSWLGSDIATVAQKGDAFAERLTRAFDHAAGPAVLVGMDTPQITPELLRDVIATLGRPEVDAVLGLTPDGGWWIVGFARPAPGAFDGVAMSTTSTGSQQLARLRAIGLRTEIVPPVTDVDTFTDALEVATAHPELTFARAVRAAATARRVAAMSA
jgi:rSAM/selenodomain-associated transferase 1